MIAQLKEFPSHPEWMTPEALTTLNKGYLLPGETPYDMYWRVASASANRLKKPELAEKFFELMWRGWLGISSPVAANMGAERGFPISCFSSSVDDSIHSIFSKAKEIAHLSAKGGGTAVYLGNIRPRGAAINGGGVSNGVVPWCKVYDSTITSTNQGSTRRGATALYLDIDHPDIEEFLRIRRPHGAEEHRCMNVHHAVVVTDEFMQRVERLEPKAIELFQKMLLTRFETGEPYIMFKDTVNRNRGEAYDKRGLEIKASNLCHEIFLFSDALHTFVCCLSSMNLTKWNEWKDTDAVYWATWFLDGVMQEFIDKIINMSAANRKPFMNVFRFATKSRALGLGVLGYHTLLQERGIPFESIEARSLNKIIFKHLDQQSLKASQDMAIEYGEPDWCEGTGLRNTHRLACAPTVTNSIICGHVSPSIEPIAAVASEKRTAKGTIIYRNPTFEKLLDSLGKNTKEVWSSIIEHKGSVQHLDFLTLDQKEVFLTAREINQLEIIRQAADRQPYIDQGQSINLFFTEDVDPTYYARIHIEAWRKGLKSLYYCRSEGLKADLPSRTQLTTNRVAAGKFDGCNVCEG